jgi:predicted Rossmann-fold nucleotide-binding protein
LEELSEFLCQRQLGLHHKPIALLNTRGFFDPLLEQFEHMTREGFLPAAHVHALIVDADVTTLLDKVLPSARRSVTFATRIMHSAHRVQIWFICTSLCYCFHAVPMQLEEAMKP